MPMVADKPLNEKLFFNMKDCFTGTILKKERHKVYSKASKFYQQIYFKLLVKSGEELLKFFVYSNYVSSTIFQAINQGKFSNQKV